jgi:hypothetical protein
MTSERNRMDQTMNTQTSALTDITIRHVLRAVLDTLPVDPQRDPEDERAMREATAEAIAALAPRDATEALFAGRAVAAHHAAMECFRRAAQPDVSDDLGMRLLGRAAALSRLAMQTIAALEQRQATARSARSAAAATAAPTADARPAAAAVDSRRQHSMPSERPPASDQSPPDPQDPQRDPQRDFQQDPMHQVAAHPAGTQAAARPEAPPAAAPAGRSAMGPAAQVPAVGLADPLAAGSGGQYLMPSENRGS